MQLSFSQQMKMSQQMKLAPRMIQSMEILQLPIMALKERIDQEISENPLLEAPEAEAEPTEAAAEGATEGEVAPPVEPVEKPLEQKELVVDSEHDNQDDFERLLNMPEDWQEDDYTYSPRASSNRIAEDSERVHDAISNLQRGRSRCRNICWSNSAFFRALPKSASSPSS